jgi:hypothetical protein
MRRCHVPAWTRRASPAGAGLTLIGLALRVLLHGSAAAHEQAVRVPVLVELFTSEGCNSCPPADELLIQLLDEQPIEGVYVVPLSEHVTYWDHQGWKDPFGSQQFTIRQQQYGLRFNLDSIYTPQLVIDGKAEYVGSDRRAIERELRRTARAAKPELKIAAEGSQALVISAAGPGLTAERDAELFFAITEDRLSVDVKRGENANRTMRHSGVVRVLRSAGNAQTALPITLAIEPSWKRDQLSVVGFVQSRKNRHILSVGFTRLQ